MKTSIYIVGLALLLSLLLNNPMKPNVSSENSTSPTILQIERPNMDSHTEILTGVITSPRMEYKS